MLDHVFTDAIGALRDAVEGAMLERQAFEERLQADVLLGDLTWETSYSLPGEGIPARARADITLEWPTWSQTAYRLWYIGEPPDEPPVITVTVVFRLQRLATEPDPRRFLAVLPAHSSPIGDERLTRSAPTVETVHQRNLDNKSWAIEVSYEGSYDLDEDVLADGHKLDEHFASMGGWITSTLVKLGDLPFTYEGPSTDH